VIESAIDEAMSQVYGNIPQHDLETAARVLTDLTRLLNALT
jgi:hypothetical protein